MFILDCDDTDDPSFGEQFVKEVLPLFSKPLQQLYSDGVLYDHFSFESTTVKEYKDYLADLQTEYHWGKIKAMVEAAGWEEEEDRLTRRVFLGTIFALTPSGKFYAPFACSNVMGCIKPCEEGCVPNPTADREGYVTASALVHELVQQCLREHGDHTKWPEDTKREIERLRVLEQRSKDHIQCPVCGGGDTAGSREARQDELWREAMEHIAEDNGLIFDQDGEDIFLSQYKDLPEEDDDE